MVKKAELPKWTCLTARMTALGQCFVSASSQVGLMGAHLVNVIPDKNGRVMGQRISLDGREMQQNGLVQFSRSIELDLKSSTHRAFKRQLPNNCSL